MVIISAIGAREGIEVLGRLADVFFPLFVFILAISLLLPLPEFRTLNLEPVLARGLGPVLQATITPVAVGAQLLVLTILLPNLTSPRLATRTALWAMAGAGFTLLVTTLITVGVLGPDFVSRSFFPFYTMTRAIEISEYLQRVEAAIIFAWGFGVFVGIAVILYSGARGLAQLLGLADYRPLVFPMAVIQGTFALHAYEDIFQVLTFFRPGNIGPYILGWFLLGLIPLAGLSGSAALFWVQAKEVGGGAELATPAGSLPPFGPPPYRLLESPGSGAVGFCHCHRL